MDSPRAQAQNRLLEVVRERRKHWMPTSEALDAANARALSRCLDEGADPTDPALRALLPHGSLLHIFHEDPRCLEVLLKAGLDPNGVDDSGERVLHAMARWRGLEWEPRHVNAAKMLLSHGADLEIQNVAGLTPAALSCSQGVDGSAMQWFQLGAAPASPSSDGSPCWARWARSLTDFSRHWNAGSQAFQMRDGLAWWREAFDALASLPGLDWEAHGGECFTQAWEASFMLGLREPPEEWRQELRSRALWMAGQGASVDAPDERGFTPLGNLASHTRHEKKAVMSSLVDELIGNGADLEARMQDGSGFTALIAAVYSGNKTLVQKLLEAGADLGALDAQGKSAFEHARERSADDVATLLGSWAAQRESREIDESIAPKDRGARPRL